MFLEQAGRAALARVIVVACLLLTSTSFAVGQSTVVSLNSVQPNATTSVLQTIATDLPAAVLQQEKRLAEPFSPPFEIYETRFGDVVQWLNRIGIATVIDESAVENNLDEDQLITLSRNGLSIETNLVLLLRDYQCNYAIEPSGLVVIRSEDSMLDNLTRITYDVGGFTLAPEQIIYNLEEIIDPDSWENNGGSARMATYDTNGRRLLVVANTYENQRRIRQQLSNIASMVRHGSPSLSMDRVAVGGSTSVTLPGEILASQRNRGRNQSKSGTPGGWGWGGGGLGGGVF